MKRNILTVDIGASKIRMRIIDSGSGEVSEEKRISLVGLELSNTIFLKLLSDNIQAILENIPKREISAISIGSPGPVNPKTGTILTPPNLKGIRNFPIRDELMKIFNLPVYLLNDADASMLGEYWLLKNPDLKNVIYITLSTGVGSGILKDGKLINEKIELGHQPLVIAGEHRMCSCNESDHAEAYLGTTGLAHTYSEVFEISKKLKTEEEHSISPKMREGTAKGDPQWLMVQEIYTHHLAEFLKGIFLTLSPELIILGGGIIFNNEPLLAKTREELGKLLPGRNIEIKLAQSEYNVNLGAAKYAFDELEKKE